MLDELKDEVAKLMVDLMPNRVLYFAVEKAKCNATTGRYCLSNGNNMTVDETLRRL
jgi:hypothetical protein